MEGKESTRDRFKIKSSSNSFRSATHVNFFQTHRDRTLNSRIEKEFGDERLLQDEIETLGGLEEMSDPRRRGNLKGSFASTKTNRFTDIVTETSEKMMLKKYEEVIGKALIGGGPGVLSDEAHQSEQARRTQTGQAREGQRE